MVQPATVAASFGYAVEYNRFEKWFNPQHLNDPAMSTVSIIALKNGSTRNVRYVELKMLEV